MDPEDRFKYEVRVDGHLPEHWSEWLAGMGISYPDPHETILTGELPDQAALYGVLMKLHNLGVTLVSVRRIERTGKGRSA